MVFGLTITITCGQLAGKPNQGPSSMVFVVHPPLALQVAALTTGASAAKPRSTTTLRSILPMMFVVVALLRPCMTRQNKSCSDVRRAGGSQLFDARTHLLSGRQKFPD